MILTGSQFHLIDIFRTRWRKRALNSPLESISLRGSRRDICLKTETHSQITALIRPLATTLHGPTG